MLHSADYHERLSALDLGYAAKTRITPRGLSFRLLLASHSSGGTGRLSPEAQTSRGLSIEMSRIRTALLDLAGRYVLEHAMIRTFPKVYQP